MHPNQLGLPFALISILAVGALLAFALHAHLTGRPPRAAVAAVATGGWVSVYLLALIATSLASSERVLGFNQPKRFCGFYLDCHAMVEVVGVRTAPSLGQDDDRAEAQGVFYVVSLKQSSDAVAVPTGIADPIAVVIDRDGHRYRRSASGERALAVAGRPALGQRVEVGGSFTTELVFDVPSAAPDPRLHVTEGHWLSRVSEFFLIGDEDSFLHKPTVFRVAS